MSTPSSELPLLSTPTEQEANNARKQIRTRHFQARQKSSKLKARLEEEEAKLAALVKEHETENTPLDSALAERIEGTKKLIASVKRNLKLASDGFAAVYDLTIQGLGEDSVVEIERRLLAVEVGLQGIQHETKAKDTRVSIEAGGGVATNRLPGERLFRVKADVMDGIEGDALQDGRLSRQDGVGESRKNLPAVGLYRV